jgi:hypothetical protein
MYASTIAYSAASMAYAALEGKADKILESES